MEIKGDGFTLRKWRNDDAAALQKEADNPKIAANLYDRFPSPYTLADAEFFINLKINDEPVTSFVIDVNGQFAGTIGLELRDDVFTHTPLVGYWLGETFWGKGIMPKALQLFTAYTFNRFDIIALQAGVFSSNPASMRVLEKAGYAKQGVLKGVVFKKGQVIDEHLYVMDKPTWALINQ
ncbi:GNAT family N-acetyltransferase [Mucilaginibacter pallidiroseus]|uniref:GNAT family N-acetyltransferase n=1 Tax=Mucilaginibacter pallidiroseus TaxID=2599295 RepID=A0A563UGV1_9SPHI|nr:GNAT family protein [Mucilaginibacter pallidiroseus]TWR30630.1 GNAT family N-acetyltransferase [Mucilaginibacter pallidiroseus]